MIIAPYGSWKSPFDAAASIASGIGLGSPLIDNGDIYWLESRPAEKGRTTLMRRSPDGVETELTPGAWNIRTRVHEYGGGAYAVRNGTIAFSNDADGRVYLIAPGATEPTPMTPDLPGRQLRYAALSFDPARRRLLAVREDHREPGEAINALVAIALDGGDDEGLLIAGGHDFVGPVAIAPSGDRIAWIAWDHPNMPWDNTWLYVADLDRSGAPGNSRAVAGGSRESVMLPQWADDDTLIFVSDRAEFWNLYRFRASEGATVRLAADEAEFGQPQWKFGMSSYALLDSRTIFAASTRMAIWSLQRVDIETGIATPVASDYTVIGAVSGENGAAVFLGGSPTRPTEIARYNAHTNTISVVKMAKQAPDPADLSLPEAIEFPTSNGSTAHAFYYPPTNRAYRGPDDALPPLVVLGHGGPTGSAETALTMSYQYWTSRGFAIVDVNYGGSTGYGRTYRERLRDNWGIVDVDDCVNAAKFLIARGDVDPERVMIRGWSASGYTTLAALTFRDFFRAGASHFGISELSLMAAETHKFESRYLDGLVGPYPDAKPLYDARSPINFVDRLSCPLILFQGLEDKVVPPNQAGLMYEAVKAKGLPVAYVAFEGEQHGFRQKENIIRAIDGELYFLSRVFGFELPDDVEPVEITNEEALGQERRLHTHT